MSAFECCLQNLAYVLYFEVPSQRRSELGTKKFEKDDLTLFLSQVSEVILQDV